MSAKLVPFLLMGLACFCCVASMVGIGYSYIQTSDDDEFENEDDILASLPEVKGLEARVVHFAKPDGGALGVQEVQVLDRMLRNMVKENMVTKTDTSFEIDLGKMRGIEKVAVINTKPPNPNVKGAVATFYNEKGGKVVKKSRGIATGDAEVYEYDWLVNTWRSGPKVGGFTKYGYDAQGKKV